MWGQLQSSWKVIPVTKLSVKENRRWVSKQRDWLNIHLSNNWKTSTRKRSSTGKNYSWNHWKDQRKMDRQKTQLLRRFVVDFQSLGGTRTTERSMANWNIRAENSEEIILRLMWNLTFVQVHKIDDDICQRIMPWFLPSVWHPRSYRHVFHLQVQFREWPENKCGHVVPEILKLWWRASLGERWWQEQMSEGANLPSITLAESISKFSLPFCVTWQWTGRKWGEEQLVSGQEN